MDPIERANWLAYRWPISLDTFQYGSSQFYVGQIEKHRIRQCNSRDEYDAWLKAERPVCLARFIAERPALHPAVPIVFAGVYRLGRIPPDLWCGYDTTHLIDLPDATVISAKARALFPAWPTA